MNKDLLLMLKLGKEKKMVVYGYIKKDIMENKDYSYILVDNKSIRDCAKHAMTKVDFHFYREFEKSDFLTERQYKSFMERAKELNIEIKSKGEFLCGEF